MPWPLITAHVHLVLVGILLMLVFGVATWTFPRPARDDGWHRPGLAVGTRGASLAALGGFGQLAAAIVFVLDMGPARRCRSALAVMARRGLRVLTEFCVPALPIIR